MRCHPIGDLRRGPSREQVVLETGGSSATPRRAGSLTPTMVPAPAVVVIDSAPPSAATLSLTDARPM